ncbi:hypothetical protein C8Q78DRAFT_1077035 [Trametes maxima]|nr:hypothetical protein C8Q78DRAFT_1077035 [Trametes maxima]
MHSVTIRRPDSIVGSEDSDQPDFRIVVDSPTAGRAVRFKSPTRSPRTMSLLMALGDVIQKDEEEGEWEEEESGEQESCSGEGSSEEPSGEYEGPPAAYAHVEEEEGETSILFSAGGLDTPARPTPILGLSEDARQLLTEVHSPEDDSLQYLESSPVGETTTLVDMFSPGPAMSPGGETSIMTDDETTIRLRRAIIPEFPLPPTRIPSPRRDSSSSGLLSPIEITPAPPISFPRHAAIAREESFDSGYADGPSPLSRTPPRSPRRMSTLSILSSPFGSPSARVHRFDASVAPAAALFSPRFGAFPPIPEQDYQADDRTTRHSRGDSIDSLDLSQEVPFDAEADAEQPAVDVFGPAREPSPTSTRHSSIPEGSSLFRADHSPVYPPIDEATLLPGEPAFGEDDTMTSLYDQYYTPTSHSFHLQPTAQDASPTTLIGSRPFLPSYLFTPNCFTSCCISCFVTAYSIVSYFIPSRAVSPRRFTPRRIISCIVSSHFIA